jgi:predicted nucleotidyltransferase
MRGLSVALDDFGDKPLIVRSSSLLEDRIGAAFSGKYKSLFVANRGSKQERLAALTNAIAEVYASTFSPDPIEYRAERGLLDFGEEMGIMIQEVVGTKIGHYYLPAFAGVAFSNNEFRWSPRIKREDGLVRLVPGLGTRAVDRLSDDYPVLIAPGQPGLRVNLDPDEVKKYSPQKIDVINLETNSFETIDIRKFYEIAGNEFPGLNKMVSVYREGHISQPTAYGLDVEKDDLVATFDGLINKTKFVKRIHAIMTTLQETLGYPVDIEFASDGEDFYLLQCRAQSYSQESTPAPIPKDIPQDQLVFTAKKYVSNGRTPDITHIVYINTDAYASLGSRQEMLAVGRAVGKLNKILPKRQFILMGPGRWGSRGDIKLGVSVTYSDINNTAVLIEIARQKGDYKPDLSFGTHFFQDLVEADIKYLPLYPDDEGIVFNNRFLSGAKNILADVLPEYAHLADTIKLIDVPNSAADMILKVLMNAELDEAAGILAPPSTDIETQVVTREEKRTQREGYWQWRCKMAEKIAAQLDPERFGVAGFYVFGSTKNATAGPASDIDILVHFRGTEEQREDLELWLEGWSLSLAEMNYQRTGYQSQGLLDVHMVTDEDIKNKTSYAAKIDAITDPAKPLPMMNENE